MPSRSEPKINIAVRSRLFVGLGVLCLSVILLLHWIPALAIMIPILGGGAVGYWIWKQWKQEQCQQQRRQAKIDATFYQLLRQQQGRISVLDFAMHTQLNGVSAQAYLNLQAQALSAYYETTPHGDVVYVFNLAGVQSVASQHRVPPAEVTWAYAEQARAEQVHRAKAQAAWANAKQIRTLHQISRQAASTQPPRQASVTQKDMPERIQAGYIAITEIDNCGQGIKDASIQSSPQKQPKSHRSIELPRSSRNVTSEQSTVTRDRVDRASDQVVTIDVQAVDVQAVDVQAVGG